MLKKTTAVIETDGSEPFSRTFFTIPAIRIYGEDFTNLAATEYQTTLGIRYVNFVPQAGSMDNVRWGSEVLQDLAVRAGYPKSKAGIPLSNGWELELFSGGKEATSFLVQTKKKGELSQKMSYGYWPQPEVIRGYYHFTDGKLGTTMRFHCFPENGINDLAVITGHGLDRIDIQFERGIFTKAVIGSSLLSRLIPGFSNLPITIDPPVVHRDQLSIKPRGIVALSPEQLNDYPTVAKAITAILGEEIAGLSEVDVLGTVGSLCQNIEKEKPNAPTECIHYLSSAIP